MDHVATVLIVDDDTTSLRILSKALNGLGQIRFATTGEEALSMVRDSPPDLVLLDAEMPGISGFDVCKAMKSDPKLSHLPVIFITSHADASMEEAGLGLGAVDFIGKPIRPAIVHARAKTHLSLKLAMDRLNQLAQTDGLTGLANRRFLDKSIEREWSRTQRNQRPFSLLLLDVDYFKRYNDCYGHVQGDQCLKAVADTLIACVHRPTDLIARYGGEEFAVLLPDTSADGATRLAENIVREVHNQSLEHRESPFGHVTVSVGVASFDRSSRAWSQLGCCLQGKKSQPCLSVAELIAFADSALYQAKNDGRNCYRSVGIECDPQTSN